MAQTKTAGYSRLRGNNGSDSPHAASAKPERVVADYIAGMTDRFAAKEHERLKEGAVFLI